MGCRSRLFPVPACQAERGRPGPKEEVHYRTASPRHLRCFFLLQRYHAPSRLPRTRFPAGHGQCELCRPVLARHADGIRARRCGPGECIHLAESGNFRLHCHWWRRGGPRCEARSVQASLSIYVPCVHPIFHPLSSSLSNFRCLGTNLLTLGRRLGFARLALEHGADLIPVFSFGENDLYRPVVDNQPGSLARRVQDGLTSVFGYTVPLVVGRGTGLGVVPYRAPLLTVIGKPIPVPHIPTPTLEQIVEVCLRSPAS